MSNLATIVNNILADSGIDDINVVVTTGSYTNPSWIVSLPWTKITGAPSFQLLSEKGQPNGYASLDSNGKVPLVQINDALIGNVNFQGLWNAATNTPTLANPPASGTKGYYYIVSTAGTFASISFEVGDWIISDGTAWGKVDNTDAVSSVFGRTGNVTASNGDYTTAQVTESGNLYYTDGRARGALSFAAGSGAYNSSTGVITIPTNNNQITNGAGYITSAALGAYLPLAGGTMTGPITTPNGAFGIVIGDDSRLADRNVANTLFIEGNQNTDRGFINFSETTGNSLGAINGGDLTWRGNTVVTGGGSAGQVAYWSSASAITGESNLFWDATNDRLGIGTDSPSTLLHVNGFDAAITISGTRGTGATHSISTSGVNNDALGLNGQSLLVFRTASTERMRITSGGNVGIGTDIPETRLEVSGVARFGSTAEKPTIGGYLDSYTGYFSTITSNNHGDFTFGSNLTIKTDHNLNTTNSHPGIQGAAIVLGGNNYTLGTNSIAFFAQPNAIATAGTTVLATSARMVIANSGNVGIGTASPDSFTGTASTRVLAVGTTSGNNGVNVISGTTSTGSYMFSDSGGNDRGGLIYYHTADLMTLTTNGAEAIRIYSDGNTFIGSSPSNAGFKLDVNGTGRFSGQLNVNDGLNSTDGIKIIGSLSSSLFTSGIEFIRTTVAGGSKVQPLRDAAIGGVGLNFLVTANNTAEVNATYTSALSILNTGAATFSSSITSSFGSSGANFNSNAATTGSVNAYRASNSNGVGSFGIESNAGNELMTNGLANATLLQSVSNTALQFGTNQTARLTITSGGNVGIGTTTPAVSLDVNGKIRLRDGGNTTIPSIQMNANATIGFSNPSSDDIAVITSSTERMRITSGGDIQVSSANNITFSLSGQGVYLSRSGLGPRASLTTRTNTNWVDIANSSDWSGVTLAASGGNVLIGTTTNSGAKLQVSGNSTFLGTSVFNSSTRNILFLYGTVADNNYSDAIYLSEDSGQATGRQSISFYNNNEDYYKARIWTQVGSSYNATLFGIDVADDARNIDTRLAIRNGNVLIGTTTSTGAKLEINGDIRTGALDGGYVAGYWKLGRALIGSQPSETHQIIVEINGALFAIGAASI